MNQETEQIIAKLKGNIWDLQQQINLVESINFDIYKPNEKEWHELMDTPVRSNKALAKQMIINLFPDASDIKLNANDIMFKLDDLTIGISTSRRRNVYIYGKLKDFIGLSDTQINEIKLTLQRIHAFQDNDSSLVFVTTGKNRNIYKEDKWLDYIESHKSVVAEIENDTIAERE